MATHTTATFARPQVKRLERLGKGAFVEYSKTQDRAFVTAARPIRQLCVS
jgi:hypothetical protein